jgi:hypothetical protein
MGNQYTKILVQRGLICYNCEQAPAPGERLSKDEFSGMVCKECFELLRAMRLKYATMGGRIVSREDRLK